MANHIAPIARAPAGACDTHMHVFGPADKYPPATRERYDAPLAPLDEYQDEVAPIGFERVVVVQPSAYGFDNSCALDSLKSLGNAGRGIVHLREDTSDEEFQTMHDLGVRGVRINASPVKPPEAGYADALMPKVDRLAERLKGTGWCIEFLNPGWLTEELLPWMSKLPVNFILCHIGMLKAADGIEQQGFKDILRLVEGGKCWLKLTGLYRFSTEPGFADVEPMFRACAAAAPERLIWGSDYPHLSFADDVDTIELYNLFCRWIEDDETRRKILVDNPVNLFGFS